FLLALILVALTLALGSGPALARGTGLPLLDLHAREGGHAHHEPAAAAPTPDLPLSPGFPLAAGLVLLAVVWIARQSGVRVHALALALSVTVGVFGLESAVHSVHHLDNPETAASCAVLAGSQHVSWADDALVSLDAPTLSVSEAPQAEFDRIPPVRIHAPRLGRAPPA
ncbi:MAG TPA: hypothetical protein VEH80_01150, partial [Candidatus Bathyarchaeia archaeon]|nr:hypothetical protein [Candidatus Bathyarchaeia archaeon]